MIILYRTTADWIAEGSTLASDEQVRLLRWSGPLLDAEALTAALEAFAESRGLALAEGRLLESNPYARDRVSVLAVVLDAQGHALAKRGPCFESCAFRANGQPCTRSHWQRADLGD